MKLLGGHRFKPNLGKVTRRPDQKRRRPTRPAARPQCVGGHLKTEPVPLMGRRNRYGAIE